MWLICASTSRATTRKPPTELRGSCSKLSSGSLNCQILAVPAASPALENSSSPEHRTSSPTGCGATASRSSPFSTRGRNGRTSCELLGLTSGRRAPNGLESEKVRDGDRARAPGTARRPCEARGLAQVLAQGGAWQPAESGPQMAAGPPRSREGALSPKAYQLLLLLLESRPKAMAKDTLWSGAVPKCRSGSICLVSRDGTPASCSVIRAPRSKTWRARTGPSSAPSP